MAEIKIKQITLLEYLKINKYASKLICKRLGVIFTSILAIFFLIFVYGNNRDLIDVFYMFLVCFFLGNFLGISFFSLVFALGYSQVRSQIEMYTRIPFDLRDLLGLKLLYRPLTSKFSFMELDIVGYDNNSFIHFEYNRNDGRVWITIRNIMNDVDFNAKKTVIDAKYKKDSVFLSGWGLKKEIRWKVWKSFSEEDVKAQIILLYRISEIENLRVEKMYFDFNWS